MHSTATRKHPAASVLSLRSQRVVRLLIGIALLGLLDLHFTLREADSSFFTELNPIAAALMRDSLWPLGLYKGVLLGGGAAILLALRSRRLTEIACWLLFATYGGVHVRWTQYYVEVATFVPNPILHFHGQNAITEPLAAISAVSHRPAQERAPRQTRESAAARVSDEILMLE